ncbi:pyridoxal-phosphate-dependent aminotransferase family protein [Tropicibacter sp. S64]|uniref:pyridoxal-phosphate-dependent aminotransferase family protein n=1 Tax=Tropicibacter sp. S64 TaxID=3415122 RepID=UPI003C7E61FE
MRLSNGRPYLAIPGPSVMPDAVLQAMHRPAPNIYEGALPEMVHGMVPDLKYVAQTSGDVAIYITNGHGMWEAVLANTVAPGQKVLVPASGRFGYGWADCAQAMGIEVQLIDHDRHSAIDPERVRAALEADKAHEIKAVLAVHVDTSTSVRSDVAALRAVLDDLGHPALLMADCIASLACDEFRMDDWGVDVMITASQKGLMTPPGLGFAFFNARAAEQRRGMTQVSRYWDWTNRANPAQFYQFFNGTAPTHHLYGLRAALDMIRDEGIEAVWARHAALAGAIWTAVEHWGEQGPLTLNIRDRALRSHAVTSMRLGAPHGERLRQWCAEEMGVTLGLGIGMSDPGDPNGTGFFRFGHMGHVNGHMILGLLGVVETGLAALDVVHQPGGVSAAAAYLATV